MFEFAKEVQERKNLPDEIKLSKIFIDYLNYYNQPEKVIRIAEKISFKGILELFDIEFEKLWNKMAVPKAMEEMKGMRDHFRIEILKLMRQTFFYFLFKNIKDTNENTVDYKKLNNDIKELFSYLMYDFFRAFDFQFQLSSLNENNDPKVIIRAMERKNQLAKQGEKFQGKNSSKLDKHYFDKVYKEYEKQEKNGDNPTYRKVAIKIAKNEMGLSHEFETVNFYKRFIKYHKKKK